MTDGTFWEGLEIGINFEEVCDQHNLLQTKCPAIDHNNNDALADRILTSQG